MRSNFFPLAYAYPERMRATRDLLRRRHRFVSLRAESYSHIQNTFSQQANFDICRDDVRKKTTRRVIPQRLDRPDLSLSVDCDLDLIDQLDETIRKIENQVLVQAKHHDRTALSILLTVPGIGRILALTMLYEIHTITRFKSAGHLLQSKHGAGKAKTLIAHKFAIAIYHMLKNGQAFDEKRFVSG